MSGSWSTPSSEELIQVLSELTKFEGMPEIVNFYGVPFIIEHLELINIHIIKNRDSCTLTSHTNNPKLTVWLLESLLDFLYEEGNFKHGL